MTISRRSVLSLAPALAALVAFAPPASAGRSVVNVRDFGAKGDGSTDDSAAIQAAVRTLQRGSILYFPAGSYRFAQQYPSGPAAVSIAGISNVAIEFDTDAELLMDNLDTDTGTGTSHGILITGPASHIELRNVKVRWSNRAPRSLGDGIRIVGHPTGVRPLGWKGPAAPVTDVQISNCEIQSSPQAGVILIGVADIDITDMQTHDTAADGLHFNACRRARINGYSASDNGDDGLALVTYFSDRPTFDSASQTFAFPALGDWSNDDFRISNVTVIGGRANGVRFAGANNVALEELTVTGKTAGAGVIVDSAAEIGSETEWQYVASRGIRLQNISIDRCETGIHLLAQPGPNGDSRFSEFDVVVRGLTVRHCSNWAVRVESLTGQPVTGFRLANCTVDASSTSGGNGGIGLGSSRDVTFGAVTITHSRPVIAFAANTTRNLSVDSLDLSITEADHPEEAPIPVAFFENAQATIDAMQINWPQAPTSWTPVQVRKHRFDTMRSDKPPVAIRKLSVKPSSVVNLVGMV